MFISQRSLYIGTCVYRQIRTLVQTNDLVETTPKPHRITVGAFIGLSSTVRNSIIHFDDEHIRIKYMIPANVRNNRVNSVKYIFIWISGDE